jgi:P2-related tail formation protein
MSPVDPTRRSSYLEHLPALFQEEDTARFLGRFLLAFEHVLSGLGDVDDPGMEELLDGAVDLDEGRVLAGVERFFDAGVRGQGSVLPAEQRAPAEFLEWLGRWVAVAFRAHMSESQRREMIAKAVPLYRKRGTREGLEQLVAIQAALRATITDAAAPRPPGAPDLSARGPHFFHVQISLPSGSIEQRRRQREIVQDIVDAEKPAHTWYELDVIEPELQVGVTSRIGVDTLIGKPKYKDT